MAEWHPDLKTAVDTTRSYIIKQTVPKVVGWAGVVIAIAGTIGAFNAGGRILCLWLLGFGALCVYGIVTSGDIEVDSFSIRCYLPFWTYEMQWSEVQYMEIDSQGTCMVFAGENKRLAVNGPAYWSGNERHKAAALMAEQIDRYQIEVRYTEKAMLRLSKNTRILRTNAAQMRIDQ